MFANLVDLVIRSAQFLCYELVILFSSVNIYATSDLYFNIYSGKIPLFSRGFSPC